MASREKILVAGIVACLGVAAYAVIFKPFAPKYKTPAGTPRGVHVVCGNPDCRHSDEHYRISVRGAWPKRCPKCEKETLCLARKCPHCDKWTADAPPGSDEESIACIHCGKAIPLTTRHLP